MRSLNHRKIAIDFGIAVVVVLFFVAGVFFESRRSHDRLPRLAGDVGAETVSTPVATQQASEAEATATPVLAAQPTATAVAVEPTAVPVLPGTPNPEAVGKAVFLDVQGIENESVVLTSSVTVTGFTTPDALLSVNGQAVPVQLDGSFSVEVNLEPRPNFVEFVSSNLRGQESSRVISVVSIQ